jgi:hypothetical protein
VVVTMTLDALRAQLDSAAYREPAGKPTVAAPAAGAAPLAATLPRDDTRPMTAPVDPVPVNGTALANGAVLAATVNSPPPPASRLALSASLGNGLLIDAATARRLACDAAVIPAVLGGRSEPLDIGRKTRTVPPALRRALVLRDGGCAFPGCTVPAGWCDAHHRHHWAAGGPTALNNLVLLCGPHHDLIHHADWQVQLPDGIPEFIPPPYLDPDQTPRRNPIHRSLE